MSKQFNRNNQLLKLHAERKRSREAKRIFDLLPQGSGSGLDADTLDGLHAKEIIQKRGFVKSTSSSGGGGVTDHGALTGLLDDDHTQYALADGSRPANWTPAAHDLAGAEHNADTLGDLNTKISDATLLDTGDIQFKTGALHTAGDHESGGALEIKLDDLKTPDDNTDLNVSTSAHGLTPKLPNDATQFLDGTGSYDKPKLDELDDVTISGVTDKEILYYDSGTSKWVHNSDYKRHREWNWADEQSWIRCITLPFTVSTSDGWTKSASNPVITKNGSGWREVGVQHPCLVKQPSGSYDYWCFLTGIPSGTTWKSESIGVLGSNDLTSWTESGSPLLEVGSDGSWDDNYIVTPAVLYDRWETDDAKRWKMWYIGNDGQSGNEPESINEIGYAYASSPDGTWTKYVGNPVFDPVGGCTWGLTVLRFHKLFYMVYAQADGATLKAVTSPNGINWTEWGTILSGAGGGAWNHAVRYTSVFWNLGVWYALVTGSTDASGANMKIGMATSYSGFRTFDWWPFNPTLTVGSGGSWDDYWVWNPSMIMEAEQFHLMYSGRKDSTAERAIGYAYLPSYDV